MNPHPHSQWQFLTGTEAHWASNPDLATDTQKLHKDIHHTLWFEDGQVLQPTLVPDRVEKWEMETDGHTARPSNPCASPYVACAPPAHTLCVSDVFSEEVGKGKGSGCLRLPEGESQHKESYFLYTTHWERTQSPCQQHPRPSLHPRTHKKPRRWENWQNEWDDKESRNELCLKGGRSHPKRTSHPSVIQEVLRVEPKKQLR